MEVLVTLFVLFIFLGIVTVVGHVIWLGIAAVYRWAFVVEQARYVPVVPRHDPVLSKLVNLKTTETIAGVVFGVAAGAGAFSGLGVGLTSRARSARI